MTNNSQDNSRAKIRRKPGPKPGKAGRRWSATLSQTTSATIEAYREAFGISEPEAFRQIVEKGVQTVNREALLALAHGKEPANN